MNVRYFNEIANSDVGAVQVMFYDYVKQAHKHTARGPLEPINDTMNLRYKLTHLREEHRRLEQHLQTLNNSPSADTIAIQRLKRQKLVVKDAIEKIESLILPDIIA